MYDKCYFCLYQLPKLKKESTTSFFVNFVRSRGTKEPTYTTVIQICAQHKYKYKYCHNPIPQSSATCHDLHNANALLWHWTYTVLAQIKKVNDPVPKYQQIQK